MEGHSIYVVSFNCGRTQISANKFASYIFYALSDSSRPPQFLVLCLQEIAPIAHSFIGGSLLEPYLKKFEQAVDIAASSLQNSSYVKVASQNVGMTGILVFVLKDQIMNIESLETAEVGVGLWEMGNKGAAGVRISYNVGNHTKTTMKFVAAHLAAMEWDVERRNEDWKNIVRRLVFEPVGRSKAPAEEQNTDNDHMDSETAPLISQNVSSEPRSESAQIGMYEPSSHLVFAGDLNYRTASSSPSLTDTFSFPQPSEDESYPRHYWHLLSSDQLAAEMKAGRTCHGLKEAPIDFPPTYKYSDTARQKIASAEVKSEDMDRVDEGKWYWSDHRWPSWCDRVLYLDSPPWLNEGKVVVSGYTALPLLSSSDHRPVACALEIPAVVIAKPNEQQEDVRYNPPFEIDPAWKQRRRIARRKEILIGVFALLTTTQEALWIFSVIVVFLILLWTGLFFAGSL
ncbi:uncharacterized protein KY384_000580 [Bacidia gigantensis]|uniref:uncharacterized protein n=1 Tax=Bacidia gigantensis TaxID=2732470 RepID=UPI001D057A75|nr:uncharacterized protein KY384_000580 [Bacidia gigantensis]KAG8525820.1 hypothetical protein KY384_000580 [Bacidia gigantensis]